MLKLKIPLSERKIFTAANFFTLSRVLLLPFIVAFLRQPVSLRNNIFLAILLIYSIVSDLLDGYIARKLNQVSVLGKILDPLADKICIGVLVVFAVIYRDLPQWVAFIVITRDVVIVLLSIILASKIQNVAMSNIYGKYTAIFLALLILSYIFGVTILQLPLICISLTGLILSSISYGKRLFLLFKS